MVDVLRFDRQRCPWFGWSVFLWVPTCLLDLLAWCVFAWVDLLWLEDADGPIGTRRRYYWLLVTVRLMGRRLRWSSGYLASFRLRE